MVLDKYLLRCATCQGSAGFLPPAGDGGRSQKGAPEPLWAPPPWKCPSPAPCSDWLRILGFGSRHPVLTPGPWGCLGQAAAAAGKRIPALWGSRGAGHWGASTRPGFGKLLASVACWWGWMRTQSRAEPRAGPHTPTHPGESCSGGSAPQTRPPIHLPPGKLKTWLCCLPRATLLPAKGLSRCGWRCLRPQACPGHGENRNFASRLSHAAPPPRHCPGTL